MSNPFSDLFDDPRLRPDLPRLRPDERPAAGKRLGKGLKLPVGRARKLMPEVGRLVADLPRGSTPEVVWSRGDSELGVHTDRTSIACDDGLVRVSLAVWCDQVGRSADRPVVVTVPFATSTSERPAGLVMSTYQVVEGPTAITDRWSDPLIAFAWECLLELCRRLTAEVGRDGAGRPLIPGSILAAPGQLLIEPMARHDVFSLTDESG